STTYTCHGSKSSPATLDTIKTSSMKLFARSGRTSTDGRTNERLPLTVTVVALLLIHIVQLFHDLHKPTSQRGKITRTSVGVIHRGRDALRPGRGGRALSRGLGNIVNQVSHTFPQVINRPCGF